MAKIAILGYGTVGSGVFEVLNMNKDLIKRNVGEEIEVKYVLDLREFPGDPAEKLVTKDIEVILNDPEVSVVVETMGGNEPAHTFVKRALESGKSVCSSNKAIIAAYGAELLKIAYDKGVRFLFGASVGGGIPIIRPVKEALDADRIESITGILNGTTNYILTKMSEEGAEFEDALKEAQDNGYAERDPEADIKGYDSCRKIAILASLVTGKNVSYEDIHTEGIDKITAKDFVYTDKLETKVKLMTQFEYKNDGSGEKLCAITAPFIVSPHHPLYSIDDVINAVWIKGNAVGDLVFRGAGAGKLPTASAVCADICDAVKSPGRIHRLLWDDTKLMPVPASEYTYRYFVRLKNDENRDNYADMFKSACILEADELEDEFAIITGEMKEKEFNQLKETVKILGYIRFAPENY